MHGSINICFVLLYYVAVSIQAVTTETVTFSLTHPVDTFKKHRTDDR